MGNRDVGAAHLPDQHPHGKFVWRDHVRHTKPTTLMNQAKEATRTRCNGSREDPSSCQIPNSLGEFGGIHKVAIAFPCDAASFINGPHHQTLAATTVARRKHTRNRRGVLLMFSFHIAAAIPLQP